MTRKPDWQALLDAFLAEHQFDSFQYGRWDCCLFVCDAIQAMTGVDPAAACTLNAIILASAGEPGVSAASGHGDSSPSPVGLANR